MDQKTERKPVRLSTIKKMYEAGEPIVMLTCYDATSLPSKMKPV